MMLSDIVFSDIYLGSAASWLAGVPGTKDPVPAPSDCQEELTALRQKCEEYAEKTKRLEFAIKQGEVAYRASTLTSMRETVYVLRRFPQSIPKLTDLGLHATYVSRFLIPGLTGLLIVAGAFGQGKTTTAASIIDARLHEHGGVAVTIEDPPEMPLEGNHGEGVCYQTWVDQGGFAEACRQAARWTPSIIFVGEVRDAETASEALRASINGRLVVCTIHADSVPMAIERIFSLANGVAGTSEDVASLIGNGLVGVLHQRLKGDPRRLEVESLWLHGDDYHGARNQIKMRKFDQLASEVNAQLNKILSGRV
ncbi:ATPase, T2SS/T4P/T4SS family [Methylovorus glucosotrophus]|nr:ATPase, T2SS/T4P/T4SS family [Methylovorus glucosotrophus]